MAPFAQDATDVISSLKLILSEKLLLKQREKQQLQHQQFQALMQKHHDEKQRMDALLLEGIIPIASKDQLYAEMEQTHLRELIELQENHQREQAKMMDLIFQGASSATTSNSTAWRYEPESWYGA